ncbi:hypothetical protein ELG71_28665 (plasmid) [Rhizobium leguminosarum]|nr:hypothetical protein ELG89_28100 [Rhizobium leguminosarum]TBG52003.1 hypothetical protein ELG71_28665 [Rhizobium leguminosarum]
MTIAIAWTRTISGCEELIFVTDSRLSGDGRTFDACPKTMTLPRDDCAIAFAGFTGHAYPMMQQLSFAIDAHAPLKRGSLELPQVKSHALKIFDAMSAQIKSSERLSSPTETNPEAERAGSVCLNSFGRFAKWISASIMPPPSLVSAR